MRTVTKISTRSFAITRHLCHICIYIFIVIIITVLGFFLLCTITTFVETDLIFPFIVIFRCFYIFNNQIIYRSASKIIFEVYVQFVVCTNHHRQELFPYPFLSLFNISCRIVSTSKKSVFCLNKIWYLIFLPEPELLSIFR